MYASRLVIEATNRDVNFRQAVNHFEFNAALVSKKATNSAVVMTALENYVKHASTSNLLEASVYKHLHLQSQLSRVCTGV